MSSIEVAKNVSLVEKVAEIEPQFIPLCPKYDHIPTRHDLHSTLGNYAIGKPFSSVKRYIQYQQLKLLIREVDQQSRPEVITIFARFVLPSVPNIHNLTKKTFK